MTQLIDHSMDTVEDVEESPFFKLFAKFNLSLDSLTAQLQKQNQLEQQKLMRLPLTVPIERVSPSNPLVGTTDIIDFGSPFDGHKWIVRQLAAMASPIVAATSAAQDTKPANPAAGADWTVTVPAGQTWALDAVTFTLATSATVGNRTPTLIIDDGTTVVWQLQAAAAQAASATVTYNYAGSAEIALRNGVLTEPLPPIVLGPGWRIRTNTAGILAGDQYSGIVVSYSLTSFASTVVTWYIGQNTPGPAAGQLPGTKARWQFTSIPNFQTFTKGGLVCDAKEHLIAGVTGLPAGTFVALIANIEDYLADERV